MPFPFFTEIFVPEREEPNAPPEPESPEPEPPLPDDSNYAKTLVIYDGDNADKAQKAADLLGCGTVMKNDGRYTYTGDILVVVGQDWK